NDSTDRRLMSTFLPLVAALIVLSIPSLASQAVAGDCQASCQLTLARCMQNGGGDSCFKTWRRCVADKGCEGAYGLEPERRTSDPSPPQACPRDSAPPSASKPSPRRPPKAPPSVPAF